MTYKARSLYTDPAFYAGLSFSYLRTVYFRNCHESRDNSHMRHTCGFRAPRPHSPDEWHHVMQQQTRLHELELERWKEVLTASVSLVDQVSQSICV